MRPEVREQFPEFTVRFEGRVATMYADRAELITIGLGCLIDPLPLALGLPFRDSAGRVATRAEIQAEWLRLKAMTLGRWHWRVQATRAGLKLRLDEATIDNLARTRLDAAEAYLRKTLPEWDEWPAEAQLATLSMAWAAGAGFTRSTRTPAP